MKLRYDDRTHSYWIDGKRCKSISAVAKIPDDTWALDAWKKRQVLIGAALDPGLIERAAAHFDDKDQMNQIAEQAMNTAKSHQAAARGTAAHRITERVDLQELIIDTPQARAVQQAWTRALDLAGLEILPEFIERIVVYPDLRIAGRFDRFARRIADNAIVGVDLKTGTSALKYPHAVAVQLALYVNAPLMAVGIPRDGGSTEQFEPLPEMDTTIGYVIHMPTDGEVNVVAIDLNEALAGMQACFNVLSWRQRTGFVHPVVEVPVASDELQQRREHIRTTPIDRDLSGVPVMHVDDNGEIISGPWIHEHVPKDRNQWITDRLHILAKTGAKQLVANSWPPGVPPRGPWNVEQIAWLDRALTAVEAAVEAPFTADPDRLAALAASHAAHPSNR
jgi:hypothetical protein